MPASSIVPRSAPEAGAAAGEPLAGRDASESHLGRAVLQLGEYAAGARTQFDLELDLRGTPFQLECWGELQRVPFGRTVTYAELAGRVGRPTATRAVGAANGANPIPIVVPCHRVLATGGGLGGFGGGLPQKIRLLEHEGQILPGLSS